VSQDLPAHARVAVVGTGFSGLGMAAGLLRDGIDDFVVLERASGIGGTWRDNDYPGCACDIPSNLYSFSFAPNPRWSRSYSPQGEIREYLERTADRLGITPHIRFEAGLERADWDDDAQLWRLHTARGPLTASVLVAGCGPLAEPSIPSIPGLREFPGPVFHSARWRHDVDLSGKRVAVIGTGASAIQFVPQIQPTVGHLTLFQRTPPWVAPRRDRVVAPWKKELYAVLPPAQRAVRSASYWFRELNLGALLGSRKAKELAQQGLLGYLEAAVPDPELRRKLTPDYAVGCKRVLISDDYYPALVQPNVTVQTEKVIEVTQDAVLTADGARHEVDVIILGTGFHVTDNPSWGLFRGKDGRSLLEVFEQTGPQAHRGTTFAGFPNLFHLVGPNTGLAHNSIVYMIEQQVDYTLQALRTMRRQGLASVEVQPEPQQRYNARVQEQMRGTVWTSGGCASWYLDKQGRNTTLWPTFTFRFRSLLKHFDAHNYLGTPRR
jgi:cation diffusion facilitator CzcD-associated flavoprotein CzcO